MRTAGELPRAWVVTRAVANVVNLSTVLGLAVALSRRARLRRGPAGLILAVGYPRVFPAPGAGAVTIGNVVLLRVDDAHLAAHPALLDHESRHVTQWALWFGPVAFLPAYLAASAWSWWVSGHVALRNPFEVRAGLVDGGYLRRPQDDR